MHNKKGSRFIAGPSDSSLPPDHACRKCLDSPRGGLEKQEKASSKVPKFFDTRPIRPHMTTKIAVFDSSGEKADPTSLLNFSNGSFEIKDSDSARIASSVHQLVAPQNYLGSLPDTSQSATNFSKTLGTPFDSEVQSTPTKAPVKLLRKRSRLKTDMFRKRRSKQDVKAQSRSEHYSRSKEPSTNSVSQSNVSTQTDIENAFCQKCLKQNLIKHAIDSKSSNHKIETKVMKPPPVAGGAVKTSPVRATNAFCTAINVTPLPSSINRVGETSYEASRAASSADLVKSKRASVKRPFVDRNEAIHQEILNLKKSVDKSESHNKQLSILKGALPLNGLVKPSYLYRKIRKANKNGSLRYTLSMMVFAILLFWLISAIFHFDFVLEIFRTVGRYLSSLPIFITRRKKELSTAEIFIKYMVSFGRVLKGILTGAT